MYSIEPSVARQQCGYQFYWSWRIRSPQRRLVFESAKLFRVPDDAVIVGAPFIAHCGGR